LADIRKVGICFITILVGSYLVYQPVNAYVHIRYQRYQPEILYLGRHHYLEGIGLPSKHEDRNSQYIYALVRDIYGKNVQGKLHYTIDGKSWNTTRMTLNYGPPANGTWMGEIPTYNKDKPYTVLYKATFNDELNYSVTEYGPYSSNVTDENFTGRQGNGYPVTDRYIFVDGQQYNTVPGKCVWNTTQNAYILVDSQQGKPTEYVQAAKKCLHVKFNAIVSVPDNGKIQKVILYMYPYKPQEMIQRNKIHSYWTYTANAVMPVNTTLPFHSTLYDSKGQLDSPNKSTYIVAHSTPPNTISVTTYISNVDISNQKANMQIKLKGPLIDRTDFTMPYSQRKNAIGKAENLNLQVIDIVNNNTTPTKRGELQVIDLASPPPTKREETEDIPGSFHNLTGSISSIGFGSFDATIGKDNSSGIGSKPYYALLSGNPLAFPLDHYSVDLFIRIPFKHVQVNNNGGTYGDWYKAAWITEKPEIVPCSSTQNNIIKCDPQTGNDPISNTDTFVKIYTEFNRNDFAFWAITFPILFIFFLLGAICFLEPEEHYLVARIAITLGVFAFVFTFDTILPYVKPHYILNISTFADFLLKLVLVAAIAFTISSLIGYRIVNYRTVTKSMNSKKWINIIHTYHIYDVLAIAFVLVMVFEECVITNRYSLEFPDLVIYPIIIILGLGWGLLSRIIFQYKRKGTEAEEGERKTELQVNPADSSEARRIATILNMPKTSGLIDLNADSKPITKTSSKSG
jgi:hypothetical protein